MAGIVMYDPNNPETVLGIAKHPEVVRQELLSSVLSTPQRNAIFADITAGSPPLWASAFDSEAELTTFACFVPATSVGATMDEKMAAVAAYLYKHPLYLHNPSFDPTIDILPYTPIS